MNIPIVNVYGYDQDGSEQGKQDRLNYILQIGTLSSALEHAVPEQMFVTDDNPGEAISAVKALSKASAEGQRIYHLTNANKDAILPFIYHDQDTMAEIRNALAVGKEVITHTDAVNVPGWSGAGYIIYDPVTGDGAYKIAGGGNGAFFSGLAFGLSMSVFLAVSTAVGGVAGLVLALALVGQILLPVYLLNQSVYGQDEQLWDCWLLGVGMGLLLAAPFIAAQEVLAAGGSAAAAGAGKAAGLTLILEAIGMAFSGGFDAISECF